MGSYILYSVMGWVLGLRRDGVCMCVCVREWLRVLNEGREMTVDRVRGREEAEMRKGRGQGNEHFKKIIK